MKPQRGVKAGVAVLMLSLLSALGPVSRVAAEADDLNGDGTSDMVWVDDDGHVALWLVSGGQVVDSATYAVGPDYRFVGSGDIDSDGDDDLVWQRSRQAGNAIAVWFMNGVHVTATWGREIIGDSWLALAVGDVDTAGGADIVFAANRLLLWDGTGPVPIETTYTLAVWYLDGAMVVGSDLGQYLQPGGHLGTIWWHSAGDFDGDGTIELLLGPRQGPSPDIPAWILDMRWPAAPDVQEFPWVSDPFAYGWSGDFTGDGVADVYLHALNRIATIQIRASDGTVSFIDLPPLASALELVGVADLDGSGHADLIWKYAGHIAVWLNFGGGTPATWDLGPFPAASWRLESSTMLWAHG
jgi:hypothetical protein